MKSTTGVRNVGRPDPGSDPAPGGDEDLSAPQGSGQHKHRVQGHLIERQRLKEEMHTLKNAQLRHEVETMRAELAAAEEDGAADDAMGPERPVPAPPPVPRAGWRLRHMLALLSFVLMVAIPTALAGWYLWNRATDRYVSLVGFSVRTEEISSAFELLGGVAELSGSSSSDTDILYRFIQSPELVSRVDGQIDLRALWAKADPARDPVYAYHPPGTIEDMTEYWNRMIRVFSDSGTGLIDLEVQAFAPTDTRRLAEIIYAESSQMINALSDIARDDATAYAAQELDQAVERLKDARTAMTAFRNRNQIVDPNASIQSQMGILSSLQTELAQTLIDLDVLRQGTSAGDPRVTQAERRVEVIEVRIEEERRKMGIGGDGAEAEAGGTAFATMVGDYERLLVDLEFAEQSYTAALAGYDSALAEARRQSRYLAAHISPTLPEAATEPRRVTLLLLVAIFAFLAWTMAVLIGYSLRDRR